MLYSFEDMKYILNTDNIIEGDLLWAKKKWLKA